MKSYSKIASWCAAAIVAGASLTACDDEKIYTTDYTAVHPVTEIEFKVSEELPLAIGMDSVLVVNVGPENIDDATIVFSSSDPAVATVDQTGKIHAVALGQAIITATPPIGFGAEASVIVKVIPEIIKVTEINIDFAEPLGEDGTIYVTDQIQLKATLLPDDHTYNNISWHSDDTAVATVDENGLVTCVGQGTAKIFVISHDHGTARGTFEFEVKPYIPIQSMVINKLDPICISRGPVALDVQYTPANGTLGSVEWSSSDESVVTVRRGVVTPMGFGSATLTATCIATGDAFFTEVTVEPGLWIWDAENLFAGPHGHESWITANNDAASEILDGRWHIGFPPTSGKWRRDIKINCSNNGLFYMHKDYPVVALRTTAPKGGNNTWDVRDSGNPKCNDGYDLADGTRLLWIDLTSKFETAGFADDNGYHGFNLFQLKVADIPNGNVDPDNAFYDVYWIRSFHSLAEAQRYADDEVAAGK